MAVSENRVSSTFITNTKNVAFSLCFLAAHTRAQMGAKMVRNTIYIYIYIYIYCAYPRAGGKFRKAYKNEGNADGKCKTT